jgi:hypothetical protein
VLMFLGTITKLLVDPVQLSILELTTNFP